MTAQATFVLGEFLRSYFPEVPLRGDHLRACTEPFCLDKETVEELEKQGLNQRTEQELPIVHLLVEQRSPDGGGLSRGKEPDRERIGGRGRMARDESGECPICWSRFGQPSLGREIVFENPAEQHLPAELTGEMRAPDGCWVTHFRISRRTTGRRRS